MACSSKVISSDIMGLRYAEEECLKELPVGGGIWKETEPNDSPTLAGDVSTVARSFLNESRQRKKGTITDLEASAGYPTEYTPTNLIDLDQGLLFTDVR